MLGAIIGDIVGSRFEWNNIKTKDFSLFTENCEPTDDSIMTLAIGKALLASDCSTALLGEAAVYWMRQIGQQYPDCGYGGHFYQWMFSSAPRPYRSFGNGAAMRVSPCGFAANSLEQAKVLSRAVTEVTHNHPEGIKGAEATATAIYLARTGASMSEIRQHISQQYYSLNFTLDEIRDRYEFNETCQQTVPQAIEAFLESRNFEDAIRNAISIGGDSDTLAAITGGIAEAYYGIPADIREEALSYLDPTLTELLTDFEDRYPPEK
jgi:type I restriction enzyme M protein